MNDDENEKAYARGLTAPVPFPGINPRHIQGSNKAVPFGHIAEQAFGYISEQTYEKGEGPARIDTGLMRDELKGVFEQSAIHGPSDRSRNICSTNPRYAYLYAKHIDERNHPVTWAGVKDSDYKEPYIKDLGGADDAVGTR